MYAEILEVVRYLWCIDCMHKAQDTVISCMFWVSVQVLEVSLSARHTDCMCRKVVSSSKAVFVSDVWAAALKQVI